MTWNLFIDDERLVQDVTWAPLKIQEKYQNEEIAVARTFEEVMFMIEHMGMPSFISFDHDLGVEKTGYDIAKKLVELDLDDEYPFPPGFSFFIHSQNPVGKKNIEMYLGGYFASKDNDNMSMD